ncbi:MAG: ABC transporter substrate-binding protein [Clostridia bacterium]|nr:ABC transporter substrate-binding protein [Clostridia bacterium]
MMKNRIPSVLLCCLLFILVCTGCSQSKADTDAYFTFTDDTGTVISLPEKPENTAVLFSSFADIWGLAGGKIAVTVGETVERGFASPDVVLVDNGAGKTVNAELLIAAKPDFVICSADIAAQSETASLLNASGIPAAQFRVESFADYLRVLKIFTDITGDKEAYIRYGTDVQAQIDALLAAYPPDGASPKRILFIRAGSTAKSTKAKTAAEHFAAAMLGELGAVNIADAAPVLIDGLSIEEILMQDPDMIFITTMGDSAAAQAYLESVFAEDIWQSLDAVRNRNYHYLPKDLFQYKPNASWYSAYELLAALLYEN